MPSALVLKTMNTMHRTLMTVSGGRIGWTAGKMPVLELTTTGRKSGEQRSTMLTSPWQDGEAMAIVASAGGNDAHPAWYLNLEADPSVRVRTEDGERSMTARTVTGEERYASLERDLGEVHELRRLSEEDRPRDPGRRARTGRADASAKMHGTPIHQ